ncbi:divalent ion tolerance protein CutA [Cymbomonas tetramitiformis]|uniref:Divalent ion tolerance protein CutA n=1 Tax=Cymbomonas tetramitiformis TaxID=36881 RepID=A0AAE0BZ41_9CHLO|nr:divalent ion tolerance protein CutA [Cymbomonas tetramitiformis]
MSTGAMAAIEGGVPSVAIYVTVPDKETGKKIASALIESKLAACVNMIPGVESMYWWEGKVETDQELLLMIKSRQSLVNEVTAKVNEVHPYDVPEVISVPITGGSDKYLQWLADSTTGNAAA